MLASGNTFSGEGTWLGPVLEHVAIEIQNLAGADEHDMVVQREHTRSELLREPHCLVIGREIDVEERTGERIPAIAEGLDADGALRVRPREGGPSFRVESADVWLADRAKPERDFTTAGV